MQTKGRIGIIGAMDCEIEYLTAVLENKNEISGYGFTFYTGRIEEKEVVIVKCGIGKVNAARGAQMMIDRFSPAVIINSGIAGGVGPEMEIGDAVIATGLIQHDFDATAFGYARGYVFSGGDSSKPTVFEADPVTADLLKKASEKILPEGTVKTGIIVTGDQFIASPEKRKDLSETFGAQAAEMEGGAIAQVCTYSQTPFAVLRVMSDKGDGTASGNYAEFEKKTAKLSSEIIIEFAKLY